jgi:hypothetical protein
VDLSDIIGLVSGLIGIFTFLTGFTSARGLAGRPAPGVPAPSGPRRSRLRLVLGLSIPVFAVSMAVTLGQGLAGSDTGGAQFLLLVAGAVLLALYALRLHRTVSWPAFLGRAVLALGGLGFLMGSVSRGEEAEGILAGVVVGTGVGLLGLAFRSGTPGTGAPPREADVVVLEREVLRAASERGGRLSVGEVALRTTLSVDDARSVLEGLATRGFCQRRPGPDGAVTYWFADFRPH